MNHDLFSEETRKNIESYGRPAVGWFCNYTPLEFFEAAELTPVRLSGEHTTTSNADSLMHTNICPYIKGVLEATEAGKFDFLKAAVFTSGCDAQRRLYDIFKERKPEIPSFLITVPKKSDERAVKRLTAEFDDLAKWLEAQFGKKITEHALIESIKLYSYLRARLRGFDGARRKALPTLTGSHALEVMLAVQHMPVKEAIQLITLEEEAMEQNYIDRGPLVLVAGNILDDPQWLRKIEEYGAQTFADNLCTSRRFWLMATPSVSLQVSERIADAYLKRPPCPRMTDIGNDYITDFVQLIENLKPDGVIFHVLKFCDAHTYETPLLRDKLREMDIKTLFVESDYTSGAEQAATRIQAFVEMLKSE